MKKNRIVRQIVTLSAAVVYSSLLWARSFESSTNDSQIFSEISSAYSSAAFPSVVSQTEELENNFPSSVYLSKALLYKGESLYCLGRFREAESVLEECTKSDSADIQVQAYYWLGRTQIDLGKSNEAVSSFYNCCQITQDKDVSKKSEEFYNLALFYAGKTFFESQQYDKGITVFESIVSRGDEYQVSLYSEAFQMLFESYLKEKKYNALVSLYKKTPVGKDQQLKEMYARLSYSASFAYENLGQYKNAWESCIKAVTSKNEKFASEALKNAYRISSGYKRETGRDPSPILEKAADKFSGNEDLLSEFWTRLGTDAYYNGDYPSARKYFERAKKFDRYEKYEPLIALYLARMDGSTLELVDALDEESGLYVDYEASFAEQYALLGDWSQSYLHAKNAYEKINAKSTEWNLCQKAQYYYGLALYSTGKISDAVNVLENGKVAITESDSFYNAKQKLLARCYSFSGREAEAIAMYSVLYEKELLTPNEKADYASLLFSCGYISAAKKMGLSSSTKEGSYIAALSCFNLKEWKAAEELFEGYISSGATVNVDYAIFYLGYSKYRLGKIEAFSLLQNFIEKYPGHSLCYNACITCANAALLAKDFTNAAVYADKAVSFSKNQMEKESAVLLCASVYEDSDSMELAIKVLSPYVRLATDFGVTARYQSALLYARLGKTNEADKLFSEIQNRFPSSPLADESSYRRGELFYSDGSYAQAASRYDEYIEVFVDGKFIEAALYYCGDCYKNLGNYRDAISRYEVLLLKNPKSTFAYSCAKNLVYLYRIQKNFQKALENARIMLATSQTAEQKKESSKEVSILEGIASGQDSKYVLLNDRFASEGGIETKSGRLAGTELAEYLWDDERTKEDAIELAEKIYSVLSKEKNSRDEGSSAAKCAMILAQAERSSGENSSSASIYLQAAKHARSSGDAQLVARALYGAAEAFDAAGEYADSKAAAENLIELYPDSHYANDVGIFIER